MANLNLVLIPDTAILQADFFTELNALTLKLYDQNLLDVGADLSTLTPILSYVFSSSTAWQPAGDGSYAIIPSQDISSLTDQYPDGVETIDLRVVLENSSSDVIFDKSLAFNIPGLTSTDPNAYVVIPVGSSTVRSLFREDGKAPDFDALQANVAEVIMRNDSGISTILAAIAQIRFLTFEDCLFIARELAWNQSLGLPPKPARALSKVFDYDFLTGSPTDDDKDKWKEKRTTFLSELKGHYERPEAQAQQLAPFIWTLVCAKDAEQKSTDATEVLFRFPVDPAATNSSVHEVNIHNIPVGTMTIAAPYWYGLGVTFPKEIGCDARFNQIIIEEYLVLIDTLDKAFVDRILDTTYQTGLEDAIVKMRMLDNGRDHLITVNNSTTGFAKILDLVTHYVNNSSSYWSSSAPAPASDEEEGHYELVTFALAQGITALQADLRTQYGNLAAYLAADADDWLNWYLNIAYTSPGDDIDITFIPNGKREKRAGLFVAYALGFFNSTSQLSSSSDLSVDTVTPPVFAGSGGPIENYVNTYGIPTVPIDWAVVGPQIELICPDDECTQAWLRKKMAVLAELWNVTNIPAPPPNPLDVLNPCLSPEIRLSISETLYSLGILSLAQITLLSEAEFYACMQGTILDGERALIIRNDLGELVTETCNLGELIYGQITPQPAPDPTEFVPINPGDIVNCVPPVYLSKLGPNAYLQDLLSFEIGDKSVAQWIKDTRNGLSFDDLLVSPENAELKVPHIDQVNELLEAWVCRLNGGVAAFSRIRGIMNQIAGLNATDIASVFNDLFNHLDGALSNDLIEEVKALSDTIRGLFGAGLKNKMVDVINTVLYVLQEIEAGNSPDLQYHIDQLASNEIADAFSTLLTFTDGLGATDLATQADELVTVLSGLAGNVAADLIIEIVDGGGAGGPGIAFTMRNTLLSGISPDHQQTWLNTIPEHSSVNGASCAYEELAGSTAVCNLPYHQVQEVSTAYLERLGSSRFEIARKFSQHIHGFTYDPAAAPADFKDHLYRLPVHLNQALEYLGLSPQEYQMFYAEVPALDPSAVGATTLALYDFFGYSSFAEMEEIFHLPVFLERACIDCCEFVELLRTKLVPIYMVDESGNPLDFTGCEDCELGRFYINITGGGAPVPELIAVNLWKLAMLIRLWRQLRQVGIHCYGFNELSELAISFGWVSGDGLLDPAEVKPHFLEQLVALEMLRTDCGICFRLPETDGGYNLSVLLQGPGASNWEEVLEYYLERIITACNAGKKAEDCRPPSFKKLLSEHIELFAKLAGFRSDDDPRYRWDHHFTNILRFTQILKCICESPFSIGQLHFIFTADEQLVGDDPFPQQSVNEALEFPFRLPGGFAEATLADLRSELLAIDLSEEDVQAYSWEKIDALLRSEFGYDATVMDAFLDMGMHFFPEMLESIGFTISNQQRQFRTPLLSTAALMWNTGAVRPFRYDPTPGQESLFATIPFTGADVREKLQSIRQLDLAEQEAVQNLCYAPRLMLAPFAAMFSSFTKAQQVLIETTNEQERWPYFQREAATFFARCGIITKWFTERWESELGLENLDTRLTQQLINHLFADDNTATTPWESTGARPILRWENHMQAGGYATLLGLIGTGLKGSFYNLDGDLIWQEARGGLRAYDDTANEDDSPVLTVLPNLSFAPTITPTIGVLRNGFVLTNGSPSEMLGGAQGYTVKYEGVLYLTESGTYKFRAGAPTPEGVVPDFDQARHSQWQLKISQGSRVWEVLDNDWETPDTPGDCSVPLRLQAGAYDVCFEFRQPQPSLTSREDGCPQPTGWEIKWTTPSEERWMTIPIEQLYHKGAFGDLGKDVDFLYPTAQAYLEAQYHPGIVPIRRTALRLLASGLLMHGMGLNADPASDSGECEIGYLLNNPELFSGEAYYWDGANWQIHYAYLDPNLLPVLDNYCPSDVAPDQRAAPSLIRVQALFAWFERLCEFRRLKTEAQAHGLEHIWRLMHENAELHENLAGHLQRYLGVPFDHTTAVTEYFANWTTESIDVLTEEWTIRIWEAMKCLHKWKCQLGTIDVSVLRPASWVSTDFTDNGNENLVTAITAAFIAEGAASRVQELQKINDIIRKKSRNALVAHLGATTDLAGKTLSEYLLTDTAVGCCQNMSRTSLAISMVQQFLQSVRLGLESYLIDPADPPVPIQFTTQEKLSWDLRLSSFEKWHKCQYRECYSEDFAVHEMIAEDRKSPGFAFLEEQLAQNILSSPVSAATTKLNPEQLTQNGAFTLLQQGIPSTLSKDVDTGLIGRPTTEGTQQWESVDHPNRIDFWVETAERLGASYQRIPAAGLPLAELTHQCEEEDCCAHCEGEHPLPVDEYFFCLVNAKYYPSIDQHYLDWEDDDIPLAQLLNVKNKDMAFLAYAKIHRGRAGALQWSAEAVKVDGDPELIFNGRYQDSLFFTVTNADTGAMSITDSSGAPVLIDGADLPPGFRFDLSVSRAVVLPTLGEVLPAVTVSEPYYFLYHDAGAPRTPKDLTATSIVIARHLQDHCQYAEARDWLDAVGQPLHTDNRWWEVKEGTPVIRTSKGVAKDRALLMTYLENMLKWAAHLRQMNTIDSLRQAAMIYGAVKKIMGERPSSVQFKMQGTSNTLSDFEPLHPGLNARLLCMYDECEHGISLIHRCLSADGTDCSSTKRNWPVPTSCDLPSQCCDDDCWPISPYNYRFLQAKASEYANALSGLGGALLSALEKGDQENLSLLRETQANQLMERNLAVRKNAVREAHFSVRALEKQLEMAECRWMHFDGLISVGLIAKEQDYISLTEQAMVAQAASQALHAASQIVMLIPEIFVGTMSFSDTGGGTKTAEALRGGASVASAIGGILSSRANLKSIKATWERREQDWIQQRKLAALEIEQLKNQLIGARLRLLNAENDLTNHHLQIDHSRQTLAFLRDKFTNQEFYRWQQRELTRLYSHAFDCALQLAQQAQRAYNIENGYTNEQFLNIPLWDNLRKGLLAGERLQMALQHLDKAYLDGNQRRYEISKSISMARMFPRQLLALRYTGKCFLEIPEVAYTKDYPGHYCRLIRSVAATIPCVVGPYVSVNATVRLHSSMVRISPQLLPPSGLCAADDEISIYELQEGDKRFVFVPGNQEAITTSKGVNDGGYHEFRLSDDRLLNFENHGAVAKFCIEMSQDDNQFDMHTMSDFILDINYTAKEGGKLLADAARANTQAYLPGNGELLLCMEEVRPDDWYQFQHNEERKLALHIGRKDFPFIPGHHGLFVDQLELFVETAPCPSCDSIDVYFQEPEDSDCIDCDDTLIRSVLWKEMGGLYYGVLAHDFDIQDTRQLVGHLKFPADVEVKRVYLILSYGKRDIVCNENKNNHCGC